MVASEFSGSIFVNTLLTQADFTRAILIGAKISSEQLATLKSLRCAVMPNGTVNAPADDPQCNSAT